MMVLRSF